MSQSSSYEILVVDDDAAVRDSLAMLLKPEGYSVKVAIDGFDALLQLKKSLPDIVISDLNMPQMSGFEFLSVVRRRFPQISVIAMSGAYPSGDIVPGGVIADAFYAKGRSSPEMLLQIVAGLLRTASAHALDHERQTVQLDTPKRKGFARHSLHCADTALRASVIPLNVTTYDLRKSRKCTLPLLPQHGEIYY